MRLYTVLRRYAPKLNISGHNRNGNANISHRLHYKNDLNIEMVQVGPSGQCYGFHLRTLPPEMPYINMNKAIPGLSVSKLFQESSPEQTVPLNFVNVCVQAEWSVVFQLLTPPLHFAPPAHARAPLPAHSPSAAKRGGKRSLVASKRNSFERSRLSL